MSGTTTKVYHALDPTFGWGDSDPAWPDGYVLVADVSVDDPDMAYELTNTIDNYWWENDKVDQNFVGDGCRSTSVGDVLVMPDGRVLRCASFGWADISNVRKE